MRRMVGVVAGLNRYPVKSMAGEELAEADLRWSGLRGDREYGFVLADRPRRFPWLTGRELSDLVRHRPICGDYGPGGLPVEVLTPAGERLAIGDPALAATLALAAGAEVQLVQLSRGTYDAMPVSLATRATFDAVAVAHGAPVDPRRFRINLVVDSAERELAWRHHILEFGAGGAKLLVTRPIERCAMITIDPDTAERDAAVMRTVAQNFANEVGEYASVLAPGPIRLGDEVYATPIGAPAGAAGVRPMRAPSPG